MTRGAASMKSLREGAELKASDQLLLSVLQNWYKADRKARIRCVYLAWRFLSKRKRYKRQDYFGRD